MLQLIELCECTYINLQMTDEIYIFHMSMCLFIKTIENIYLKSIIFKSSKVYSFMTIIYPLIYNRIFFVSVVPFVYFS